MTNRTYKTGVDRGQLNLLPPRIDDYVGPANLVRGIEAYVRGLNLRGYAFRHAGPAGGSGAGQPSYDPADLLKLYIYGYINRVRSSRALEREAQRNVEVMWLLGGLTPGYRTIANFRKDNGDALRAVNRGFVQVMRELELVGGELVAIDGAFFHGDASKGSIKTRGRLEKHLAAVDRDIEAYSKELDANDAAEEAQPPVATEMAGVADKVAALMEQRELEEQREKLKADLARLDESGETQVSRTDPDARLLMKRGQKVAGYNVQIAVDEKHKLIVASEVVNDGNDTGQLHDMAQAAKEALGAETLQVVADGGYYNGVELKKCEDDGSIVPYVAQPDRNGRQTANGRFGRDEFTYDAEADAYRCPANELLKPSPSLKNNGGRMERPYVSRKPVCDGCPLRAQCVNPKSHTRTIYRWEHEDVVERHQERMKGAQAQELMRRRKALVEHPFGTLKCRAGYRHFLVRGFDKVRGEWSLMALCYNLSRVLSIVGLDRFTAYMAERAAARAFLRVLRTVRAVRGSARTFLARLRVGPGQNSAIAWLSLGAAA
jgi:transposase